ncbi:uncharacterized protein LOC120279631 isoform X2 [Dioscorea cayenensis subsp. rotundata]|uniref:Uncharacterized protein LOC120279631 isoform X2 n=1 Tax=Dioscorea cayennensis subsp. rotundata TaxID=55577 RepID=A0AB40CQY0_DIOCR|nr:uncharacterized protein LOC120279631 isoform X2 [Dioscorea cayenensis subsp. rotundata]
MASSDAGDEGRGGGGGAHVVPIHDDAPADEISPFLAEDGDRAPRKMSIFSVSYPNKNRPPKEPIQRAADMEVNLFSHILWVWNGSRYSGVLCMVSASTIYFIMEVLMDNFPGYSVPLLQTVLMRCTTILIISLVWLRKTEQPIIVPKHIRNLLFVRSLFGFISLMTFIYSVHNLPQSQAVVLNFTTPLIASMGARIILQEKLTISDAVGLTCSFIGLLFIFQPVLITREIPYAVDEPINPNVAKGRGLIYPLLVGIVSSMAGGISYCLIRAGAKASDQPLYTVLSFGILATPLSAIFTFTWQEFVLPNFFTFLLMIVLSILAFFAELSLARGLQLLKVCKSTNILYIKVLISQVCGMTLSGLTPSFNRLIGCFLIFVSVCSTVYTGPEKDKDGG